MSGPAVGTSQVLLRADAELGEGVLWDADHDELLWVDIVAGALHRHRLTSDGAGVEPLPGHRVPGELGAALPVADGSGWVLATELELVLLRRDGSRELLLRLPPAAGDVRCNDAACDPAGRLLVGTMARDLTSSHGALHRLGLDGSLERLRGDLTISNGLGWSPDGTVFYAVDSGAAVLSRASYDVDTGAVGAPEVLRLWDHGVPDGLAVGADGRLWVAVHGGGRVDVVTPDGRLDAHVPLPVPLVTNCAFAGPGRDRLVVTTAREGMDAAALAAAPASGSLFVVEGVGTGLPTAAYAGPLPSPSSAP